MSVKKRGIRLIAAFLAFLCCAGVLFCLAEIWPQQSESKKGILGEDGGLKIDYSHASDGYIMVKGPKTNKRLKLRIKFGDETLTYDLNGKGEYEVFPLQLGSGKYKVILYRNVSGNKYSEMDSYYVTAELTSENVAFLCPNQYVNYTPDTPAVAKAHELCAGLQTDLGKFNAITGYIEGDGAFSYDYVRAVQVKGGDLPDIEACWKKRMGICQDLAAMVVCMLRVENIPAKLVIGYADKNYHAWVLAYIDGKEVFYDPTAAINAISRVSTYIPERFY